MPFPSVLERVHRGRLSGQTPDVRAHRAMLDGTGIVAQEYGNVRTADVYHQYDSHPPWRKHYSRGRASRFKSIRRHTQQFRGVSKNSNSHRYN